MLIPVKLQYLWNGPGQTRLSNPYTGHEVWPTRAWRQIFAG